VKDDAKFAEARTKYVTYIADMLLASALLFMVLAILLTKMRVVRG